MEQGQAAAKPDNGFLQSFIILPILPTRKLLITHAKRHFAVGRPLKREKEALET